MIDASDVDKWSRPERNGLDLLDLSRNESGEEGIDPNAREFLSEGITNRTPVSEQQGPRHADSL